MNDEILAALVRRGLRLTTPRIQIVKRVLDKRSHFTAEGLSEELRMGNASIGRATVYRTLDLLAELGYVQKLHLGDGCHSYAVCVNTHHHHLVCQGCGNIVDIQKCDLGTMLRRLSADTGYQITNHHLEIFGRCESCQAAV